MMKGEDGVHIYMKKIKPQRINKLVCDGLHYHESGSKGDIVSASHLKSLLSSMTFIKSEQIEIDHHGTSRWIWFSLAVAESKLHRQSSCTFT